MIRGLKKNGRFRCISWTSAHAAVYREWRFNGKVGVVKEMNSILVPVDFSEDSRLAIESADRQAAQWGCGLILVHVKKPDDRTLTRMAFQDQAIERWVCLITFTPRDHVTLLTCEGDPAEVILHIAERYQTRKIVMGRGGDANRPGAVAATVGRDSRQMVELVSTLHSDVFVHAAQVVSPAP